MSDESGGKEGRFNRAGRGKAAVAVLTRRAD